MKKVLLLTLPALLLSACDSFINFSKEKYDEGFSGDIHTRKVEYYNGDELHVESLTSHVISFKANETNSQPELKTYEDVISITNDADGMISDVEDIVNVNQFHGLKIGHVAEAVDGSITFHLTRNISAIKVLARPRAALVSNGTGYETVIDSDVALSVNDSKYIKVKSDFTTMESITDSELCYLVHNADSLTFNAVYHRLEIMQITLYE